MIFIKIILYYIIMIYQMNLLPCDAIFNIVKILDFINLISLSKCNKYFQELCKNDLLWKEICTKYYDSKILLESYYETFKLRSGVNKLKLHFDWDYNIDELYRRKCFAIRNLGSIIPSEIGLLINLTCFVFQPCGSTNLPSEISLLTNLERFTFSCGSITEFPRCICKLYNLEYLDLSDNNIKIIPIEISNLINLKRLRMSCNDMDEIPAEMCTLYNLRDLHVEDNKIVKISKEIGNLHSLKFLDISDNQIEILPKEINDLKNFTDFSFDGNPLLIRPKIKWIV